MKTEDPKQAEGAGATRPPRSVRPGWRGTMDRVEAVGLRFPRWLKLLGVWVGILSLMFWAFVQLGLDTDFMREQWRFILGGIGTTIYVSFAAIILAIPLALFGALGRLSKNALPFGVATFYTSFFRGTPLLVQLFFVYNALPQLALAGPDWMQRYLILSPEVSGILALSLNYGAYMTEIFRAGIQSVGHGQIEAAHALGMGFGQTMRRITLPQAVRVIIPPTGNEYIAMIKDTALLSIFGTGELFWRASKVGARDFRYIEALIIAAAIYWILTSAFSLVQSRIEAKLRRGMDRGPTFVLH